VNCFEMETQPHGLTERSVHPGSRNSLFVPMDLGLLY
jgi:hypothetical protein